MKFVAIFFTICVVVVLLSNAVESRPDGQVGMECKWEGNQRTCKPAGNIEGWKELAQKTGKELERFGKKTEKELKRFGKRVKKVFG